MDCAKTDIPTNGPKDKSLDSKTTLSTKARLAVDLSVCPSVRRLCRSIAPSVRLHVCLHVRTRVRDSDRIYICMQSPVLQTI